MFGSKAPFGRFPSRFRFASESGIGRRDTVLSVHALARMNLFDHLIGASEERRRHGQTECLGRLHVNNQLEFGRLLNRQIGRLGTFEDFINVPACAAEQIGYVGPVDD
jgi:hypothetical protein